MSVPERNGSPAGPRPVTDPSYRDASLERRVVAAAGETLSERKFVTVADVCIGLGWLTSSHAERWQQGRVPDLESQLPVRDERLAQIPVIIARPLCLTCADPDHLVFLPAGDAALTRRAKKASRLSAAGRSLDGKAITLAVVASVRHEDTGYDSLLMSGVPRDAAREQIRDDIDRVLLAWS